MRHTAADSNIIPRLATTHLFLQSENANRSTMPTKRNRAASTEATQHEYHTTSVIICKSAYLPNFSSFFYGTSHLEKSHFRRYYEDTKRSESNVLSKLPQKQIYRK